MTPSAVRGWYLALRAEHPVTADDAFRLLRVIYNTAKTDGKVASNPCQVKGAGQVHSPERPTATIAEVTAAVEAVPERYRLALLLSAWCQLRRGEVLALQRRNVDPMRATIHIERSWSAPMGQQPVIGPPKTEKGVRTLAVPPNMLPALADHLKRFVGAKPDAWLFATSTGTAVSPRDFNRVWAAARLAIGRPDLHLHDLRHSGLTWAAATGASVAHLMRRSGHANPRAALRYQHATEDRDAALAAAMAELVPPASVTPIAAAGGRVSRADGTHEGHDGPRTVS